MKIDKSLAKRAALLTLLLTGLMFVQSFTGKAQSTDPPSKKVWDGKACSENTQSQCMESSTIV